ncbi:hypothetical protein [Candidatus Borrarchaeum sp.]|uniref:hypothetical protein n=1 Tax=Candidatus Borrarchaeum sp. TaxID=2846742 RepID=UPI002579557C|nr:hypothetical protein [Candidatus Borrarchaeum sp.]
MNEEPPPLENANNLNEISEIPLNAEADFYVSEKGISELLVYNYLDEEYFYQKLCASEDYDTEMSKIKDNMQFYLDQDKVLVNHEEKRMKLSEVELKFKDGLSEYPQLNFMILIRCKLKEGNNIIEFDMEDEIAPYDFLIKYHFPHGSEIVEVESLLSFKIIDNKLIMTAKKGDRVGGYEKIVFKV